MQLKKRKSALMLLLSLMLATTSCANAQDDLEEEKKEYMESIEKDLTDNIFVKDRYENSQMSILHQKFYSQLTNAAMISADNDEAYNLFFRVASMKSDDNYNSRQYFKLLDEMLEMESTSYGHGFYYALQYRLRGEEFYDFNLEDNELFLHMNTLRSLVDNDEAFYKAVFSKDINQVIDVITENIGIKDRSLIEELMISLDQYRDLYQSNDHQDKILCESYARRINEIMNTLVQTKYQNDSSFFETFYGRELQNSQYFNSSDTIIIENLFDIDGKIRKKIDGTTIEINIPAHYLFSDKTLEDIKRLVLSQKIKEAHKEDASTSSTEVIDLLIHLFNYDALDDIDFEYGSTFLDATYKDVSKYFSSPDEYNTFILGLYNKDKNAFSKFFDIFEDRIKEDGITYDDFIRFACLDNYIRSRGITHFKESGISVTYDDLCNMLPEEYEKYVTPYGENFLFDTFGTGYDHQPRLDAIRELLKDNDLGYEYIYDPDACVSWRGSYIYRLHYDPIVISSSVSPKEMDYNGSHIVYYEYPEKYENGTAVEAFINLENALTVREVKGIPMDIIDPETDEPKHVIVVSMNGHIEDFSDINFMTYYTYFKAYEDTYELTYGGAYE